jgi:hypothetical protein
VALSVTRHSLFSGHGEASSVKGELTVTAETGTIAALDLDIALGSVALHWADQSSGPAAMVALPRPWFRTTALLARSAREWTLCGLRGDAVLLTVRVEVEVSPDDQRNVGGSHHGKNNGMPSLTRIGKSGLRFSMNENTPSFASSDSRRA